MDTATKIFLIIIVIVIIFFIVKGIQNKSTPESGSENGFQNINNPNNNNNENFSYLCKKQPDEPSQFLNKLTSQNAAPPGQYKTSRYNMNNRSAVGDWSNYFDNNNTVLINPTGPNNQFNPSDETGKYTAPFQSDGKECKPNQELEPEEVFDLNKFLPQETKSDWFEVMPEPIPVKNRHLISVSRPLGINTVAQSRRNASHDLRSDIPNPKDVVSPWGQSTIEVNLPLKSLCN